MNSIRFDSISIVQVQIDLFHLRMQAHHHHHHYRHRIYVFHFFLLLFLVILIFTLIQHCSTFVNIVACACLSHTNISTLKFQSTIVSVFQNCYFTQFNYEIEHIFGFLVDNNNDCSQVNDKQWTKLLWMWRGIVCISYEILCKTKVKVTTRCDYIKSFLTFVG